MNDGTPARAIVLGAGGKVGSAFASRLVAEGIAIVADPVDVLAAARKMGGAWLFDGAYRDGETAEHVQRVARILTDWGLFGAIFLPSSAWIGQDSDYGRAKQAVEALANFYAGLGAPVVTDRIGYFPGDGIAPDPNEPMIDQLVDGDTLYARVMVKLRAAARRPAR